MKENRKFKVGEDEFPVYIAYKNLTEDVPYMKVHLDQKKIAELQKVAKQCVHASTDKLMQDPTVLGRIDFDKEYGFSITATTHSKEGCKVGLNVFLKDMA